MILDPLHHSHDSPLRHAELTLLILILPTEKIAHKALWWQGRVRTYLQVSWSAALIISCPYCLHSEGCQMQEINL